MADKEIPYTEEEEEESKAGKAEFIVSGESRRSQPDSSRPSSQDESSRDVFLHFEVLRPKQHKVGPEAGRSQSNPN